jgi:putative membrane protein
VWLDWNFHPDVVSLLLTLQLAYLYVVFEFRNRIPDAGRVKRSQIAYFSLGVFVLYIASGTPIHELSENYLASVHMFQHLLFMLIAAPLLLAGIPSWLYLAALKPRPVMAVARALTKPLIAFALFNAILVFTHLPFMVDLSLRVHWFHLFVHMVLVASALIMWWPILSPLAELPRLSYPLQMGYLFVQSLFPSVIASFITFSDRVVYEFYAEAPRIWGLTAIHDQQIAGGLMKVLGSLILWCFIAGAFFRWYEREEAQARGPQWDQVENELDELGLLKKQ